jgi:DNA-binding CsgD family transcriptional regulator/tetratricopeptide (TPR) repeat protein
MQLRRASRQRQWRGLGRQAIGITLTPVGMAEPVERAAELKQLSGLLAAAGSGRGQVCVVEGPSGIGKSRLLDECAGMAVALGMNVLRARGSELARDYPFGVARHLFEARVVRADVSTRARLMRGPAALAEPMFGHGQAADEFGVLHGLYWLTLNLAEQLPTVILVDDLPWADDSSLRFFAYLAERLDDAPVALVVALRSGDPGSESQLISHLWDVATAPPIRPGELTEHGVEMLLTDVLPGHDVDVSLANAVVRQTGGNPFLVLAVADGIRDGENLELTTPESVRRRVARRLARLDPAALELAKAASVLGDDIALRDGTRLAGLNPDRGRAAGEELVRGHFLQSADPITFTHRIVGMAVYSLLGPDERLALHLKSAKLLAANQAEPEVVAEHLLMSGPNKAPWALEALHEAGRAAARKGAPAAALRYLRHAVDVADTGELAARVLIDVGLAEAAAGEPTSLDRFEQALDLMSEPMERAEALYSFGGTLYRFGRYADARVAFRRGAQLFEGGNQQLRLRFEGAALSAETHLTPTGRGPEGVVDGDGPGTRAILAVQALRASLITPPASRAADLATRALSDGALLAEQGSEGPSVNLAVLALLQCGHLIEAHDAADATLDDARERGAHLAFAEASLVRALVLYARGRVIDAAADAQAALDGMRHEDDSNAQSVLATLVHCMIERGDLTEAANVLGAAGGQLAPTPAINAYVCLARGRMHLRLGDLDTARKDLDAAENAMVGLGATNPTMLAWRSLAGVIAHLGGDEARAADLIQEEIRLARSFDVPIALGIALRRRALTETGDRALASLREASITLDATEAKLELAYANAGLGRGLRRAGQRVEAREHLGTGLDLAHRCGATGLETEIREELVAAGGRPRRPAVSGVDSLTPTELRVAHFAARGMSNRDIAEQTFVSRSTVAWHLHNVYRKLHVESREQLAPHLDT